MPETTVSLLDTAGQWTHRERHRHHEFPIDVPERAIELRVRFWWSPREMGSEHAQNAVGLALFGPDGFRGVALRSGEAQELVIGESTASPGSLAGPIRPGRWVLSVDSALILNDGAKAGFLSWRVEASATLGDSSRGEAATRPAGAAQSSAAGPARWYRGDLHSHTRHSDGAFTVPERVRVATDRGLDFLAITDHNTISHHRELKGWPDGITPVRGSEVTTFYGHMNVFGLSSAIDWRGHRRGGGAAGVVEAAHRQGALVSINHPSSFGDPWCVGCHWTYARVDYSTFDAMEVWNGGWADVETDNEGNIAFWTDLLDAGLRLTAIAGTDSHGPVDDDDESLGFTSVYASEPSEAAILEGIRRGRAVLSRGPTLSFRARGSNGVDVTVPGESMVADGPLTLDVDIDGLERAATVWFVTSGSAVPLAEGGPGSIQVAGADATANRWWRLELRAGSAPNGDIFALTNPVFMDGR